MMLPTLSGRFATTLLFTAVLAAPAPADDLFIASSNSLFARGDATGGGFQTIGACLGVPQAMAVDETHLFLGDTSGRIYRFDLATTGVTLLAHVPTDARTLTLRGNELLVGGGGGIIQRVDKKTGSLLPPWQVPGDVVTVLVHRDRVYAAWNPSSGSIGQITEFDADGVTLRTLGVWGLIDSMAADATHLIVVTPTITFRQNLSTGFIDGSFILPDDVEVILVQGGSLVAAGSDGVVRRFNRVTGAPQGTMPWTSDIISMATLPSSVGSGSCYAYHCPCGNSDALAGCRNSTGVGSWLGGSGSASLTADDLTLAVTNVPPGTPGRLFMGATATTTPFGDGLMCAGGGLHRFPVQSAGPHGTFTFGPGIAQFSHDHFSSPGVIQAGFTWHFQAWYRNPSGPCGSGFNTSNSFRVTFAP